MLSRADRATSAWVWTRVLQTRSSPPVAAPAREQSAQVREATAHLLVLEPFEFRARFALSGQELAFLGALQALARVRAALVRVSVPAPGLRLPSLYSTAPDGLTGANPNGSYSWRSNTCFFGQGMV